MKEHAETAVHHAVHQTLTDTQNDWVEKMKSVLSEGNVFGQESEMVNVTSREVVPEGKVKDLLQVWKLGEDAEKTFVEERIRGDKNIWDKMKRVKPVTWDCLSKTVGLKTDKEVVNLRATSGLMSRLLIITRSNRKLNVPDIVGCYEMTTVNKTLIRPDGNFIPTTDKTTIVSISEKMQNKQQPADVSHTKVCEVADGMAIVQALMDKKPATCLDLANDMKSFVEKRKRELAILFDNYNYPSSLR